MTDEDALLAAILAHPDEDTPRLIYADWLDEHGHPERAEFIRLQCAPDADAAAKMRARELEKSKRAEWLGGLTLFPDPWAQGRRDWVFCRGFPEHLSAPISDFLDRYDESVRVPWLRFLALSYIGSEDLQNFANRPWNPRWVELTVEGPWSIRGVPPDYTSWINILTRCPSVSQLRGLWLAGLFDFTPEGIELLVASPHLENLHQLHLVGDEGDPRFDPLRERFGGRLVIDWYHPGRPRM
jgi:uncharacterized protein (TIGR02996 family)